MLQRHAAAAGPADLYRSLGPDSRPTARASGLINRSLVLGWGRCSPSQTAFISRHADGGVPKLSCVVASGGTCSLHCIYLVASTEPWVGSLLNFYCWADAPFAASRGSFGETLPTTQPPSSGASSFLDPPPATRLAGSFCAPAV